MSNTLLENALRPSPLATPGRVIRRFGPAEQPIGYYLYQDVVEELAFAASYEDRVYGAVLTGGFGLTSGSAFVEVTGFVGGHWVDSVEELYRPLREECEQWALRGEGGTIAGCFISQRGSGAMVDVEAARIHYSLFNIPFQALVTFDPDARKVALSARSSGTPLFNAAFDVVVTKLREGTSAKGNKLREGTSATGNKLREGTAEEE